MKKYQILIFAISLIFMSCAAPMRNVDVSPDTVFQAKPDKALLVVMRSGRYGYRSKIAILESKDNQLNLVGFSVYNKKIAYELDPGQHLFMTSSENADFLQADMEAGKTYYINSYVTPGFWSIRSRMDPITKENIVSDKYTKILTKGNWIEKTQKAEDWTAKKYEALKNKHDRYLQKWMKKDAHDKPTLFKEDGVASN